MEVTHAKRRSSRAVFIILLLLPIWFPFVYTGAVLLRITLMGGSEFSGVFNMRGLYFLTFLVAAIGTLPLFKNIRGFSIVRIVLAILYYAFVLVISYVTAWILTIQAFGP